MPTDVVATVIVLQTLHGLSDREAEAVAFDLRWKAVCGLPVTAPRPMADPRAGRRRWRSRRAGGCSEVSFAASICLVGFYDSAAVALLAGLGAAEVLTEAVELLVQVAAGQSAVCDREQASQGTGLDQ